MKWLLQKIIRRSFIRLSRETFVPLKIYREEGGFEGGAKVGK